METVRSLVADLISQDMTDLEIAQEIGVTKQTIYLYQKGERGASGPAQSIIRLVRLHQSKCKTKKAAK